MLETEDIPEMAMFETEFQSTHEATRKRQDVRGAGDNQMWLKGILRCFIGTTNENGSVRNVEQARPGKVQWGKTDDGRSYPKAMPLSVTVKDVSFVKSLVEPRSDQKKGWSVRLTVSPLPSSGTLPSVEEYLRKNAAAAWAADRPDKQQQLVRRYIKADGNVEKHEWYSLSPGEAIKVKVKDGDDSELRQSDPATGNLRIQGCTPMTFINLKPERFLKIVEREVEDTTDAAPSSAPADGKGGNKKKKTRKVVELDAYKPSFTCQGNYVASNDFDLSMPQSERMHECYDPNVHQLVPIEEWTSGREQPESSAYFYVRARYITPFARDALPEDGCGITVLRAPEKTASDFVKEFQGQKSGQLTVRFDLFQWKGRPSVSERYVIKVLGRGDGFWRSYGITDLEPYGMIVGVNPDVPLHVVAQLWDKATLESLDNGTISNHDAAAAAQPNYYVFLATDIVPDLFRYFATRGMRLSADYVRNEFAHWEGTVGPKTALRATLTLKPRGAHVPNPVNVNGLTSAVLALGNGHVDDADPEGNSGRYHAFDGNIISLFEGGRHDFYVLTSHENSVQERAAYCGPRATAGFADTFLDQLKQRDKVFYWIYAVRRDVKRASNFPSLSSVEAAQRPASSSSSSSSRPADATADIKKESGTKRDATPPLPSADDGDEGRRGGGVEDPYEDEEPSQSPTKRHAPSP
jgi:hypothetical protein